MISTSAIGRAMNDRESQDVLRSNGVGVLSLGVENRGYGFPISYTYDEDDARIVFGFVVPPESDKAAFVAETDVATFTVFSYDDVDAWQSVVASGPLHPVDADGDFEVPNLFFRREADEGADGEQSVDLDQFERDWYALRIETLSGRQSDL